MSTNFAQLRLDDEQLFRLGSLAERYFPDDPNTSLLKLRQLGELLAQQVASRFGVELRQEETQQQLLRRLECDGVLEREVAELFHGLRRKGNLANHDLHGDHATALKILRMAWQLGVWFHRTFRDPQFRSGPFQPPWPSAWRPCNSRPRLRGPGLWPRCGRRPARPPPASTSMRPPRGC
ncbi:MAG: DUF4145 domain-containing protein [Cyanobium sp.]